VASDQLLEHEDASEGYLYERERSLFDFDEEPTVPISRVGRCPPAGSSESSITIFDYLDWGNDNGSVITFARVESVHEFPHAVLTEIT